MLPFSRFLWENPAWGGKPPFKIGGRDIGVGSTYLSNDSALVFEKGQMYNGQNDLFSR